MIERRIKVAYIVTPITFGGAEKVSINFLRSVNRNRYDVRPIVLIRPWEDTPYFVREICRFGYDYIVLPVAVRAKGDYWRVLRVVRCLYSILKRDKFDLVHTHGYFADICALPVARLLGVKSVSTCHGYIASDIKLGLYNLLDRYVLRCCTSIIAVSDDIKHELLSNRIQSSRVMVVPNAVETSISADSLNSLRQEKRDSLKIEPHELVIGYLGRLSEEKGICYLIEAVARLRDSAELVKLLLVGDGSERLALERQVRMCGLDDAVTFAGFQTDTDCWLSAFDIFALPSLTEGTPMALLEAMAAGVPVIASAVGGVPNVVTDGDNGLLVPPGDPAAICDRVRLLKDNNEMRYRLGRTGRDTVCSGYGISAWCRKIEDLYCRVGFLETRN